jgi:hypothetical protein
MRYYLANANTGELKAGWYSTPQRAKLQADNWYDHCILTFLVKATNRNEATAKATKAHETRDYKSARV